MTREEIELHARMTFAPFLDPACAASWSVLARTLRPCAEEVARVFVPRAVPMISRHVDAEWSAGGALRAGPGQTAMTVSVRWAHEVTDDGWPRVYRRLAEYLVPDVAWMRLRFHAPHERRGMMFDGLVYVSGRWRWFPRVWRALPTTPVAGWGAD